MDRRARAGVHWEARCANGREPEVSATVEHVFPLPLPMFKHRLGANLREFGQDRCEGFVHLTLISKHMKNIVILGWEDLFNFLQCIILAMIII